jgi:hypothetical protein
MRKRLRKSTIAALLIFGGLTLLSAMFLHWQNTWIAERIAGTITHNLLSERGYALELEAISGNPFKALEFRGLRISYQGDLRKPFDLLTVEWVKIHFNLLGLARGDFRSSQIDLRGVVLRAFPMGSSEWAYPGFNKSGGEQSDVIVEV